VEFPETPEGVALALLWLVLASETDSGRKRTTQRSVLDTFGECLRAAKGERGEDYAERLH
jgi:hypothetical protein